MTEKKVSISIGELQQKYGDEQALVIAKEIGADAVDFSTFGSRFDDRNSSSVYSRSEDEFCDYFANLKKRADELGIGIAQTHGRIEGFQNDRVADEALVRNAELDCKAAGILGAPVCVMHNVTTIFMGADAAPSQMHQLNFEMYSKILPFAKKYGIKIATETFGDATGLGCCDFFGNINEFVKAYEALCSVKDYADYFTVCVDTGHSNKAVRYGNPLPADVIRKLGRNTKVLHLNDNDGLIDQHKIPMTGNIVWEDVFDALDEVNYQGIYNMELNLSWFGENFMIETAEVALKGMRKLLFERYG